MLLSFVKFSGSIKFFMAAMCNVSSAVNACDLYLTWSSIVIFDASRSNIGSSLIACRALRKPLVMPRVNGLFFSDMIKFFGFKGNDNFFQFYRLQKKIWGKTSRGLRVWKTIKWEIKSREFVGRIIFLRNSSLLVSPRCFYPRLASSKRCFGSP
jgi:hypothetical protein